MTVLFKDGSIGSEEHESQVDYWVDYYTEPHMLK